MDTDSFIAYIKTDDIYKDIAEDVEKIFDTSNYELEWNSIKRPLLKGKIKRNLVKEKRIRPKTYDKTCWTKSKN